MNRKPLSAKLRVQAAGLRAPLPARQSVSLSGLVEGIEPLTPTLMALARLLRSCNLVVPSLKFTVAVLPL
ncbi:hypothetical protein D3C79_1078800 [compost metagenome]